MLTIKRMETDEEIRGKAYVHWRSWHEAYAGIVDARFLEEWTLEKCERIAYRYPDGVLIAKDGERVVGFAACSEYRGGGLSNAGEIIAIYVLADHWGQGIGSRLMRESLATLQRYPRVAVMVLKKNSRAIRFYERFGFRFDGYEETPELGSPVTEARMVLERTDREDAADPANSLPHASGSPETPEKGGTAMSKKRKIWAACLFCFLLFAAAAAFLATSMGSEAKAGACTILLGQENASDPEAPDLIGVFSLQDSTEYGCVLPASWDASSLRIFLTGAKRVRIDGKTYRNGDLICLKTDEPFSVKPGGHEAMTLTVRRTGGLPVVFIRTESGSTDAIHADKTYREPGSLLMTDADGNVLFREALSAVRARGNATMKYVKKPYQIKLERSSALTGENKSKTWILLANALDRTQIRYKLALDLARYCGVFAYTPQAHPVDLYMNGDYRGTFLLTEKVETGKNRVAVTDLEKAVEDMNPDIDLSSLEPLGETECVPGARKYHAIPREPEDRTGGYIVQINYPVRYVSESSGFVTERGCVFTLQEPKYASEAQILYIAGLFQRIEDALCSEDGIDPASGLPYTELLDLPSFVDRYLVAELLNDYDGQLCYLYKDSDAVDPMVYAGPVWDQDNILGLWLPSGDPDTVHIGPDAADDWTWFSLAAKHADCAAAIAERFDRVFLPAIGILLGMERDPGGVLRSVDEYAEEVRVSAQADRFRWKDPISYPSKQYNHSTGDTFEEQVAFLKGYLEKRGEALKLALLRIGP